MQPGKPANKHTRKHRQHTHTAAALLSSLPSLSPLPRSFDLVIVAILITSTSMKETTLPLRLSMPLLPPLPLPLPVPLLRPLSLSTAAQQQQKYLNEKEIVTIQMTLYTAAAFHFGLCRV